MPKTAYDGVLVVTGVRDHVQRYPDFRSVQFEIVVVSCQDLVDSAPRSRAEFAQRRAQPEGDP